jgi:hypothetical protein
MRSSLGQIRTPRVPLGNVWVHSFTFSYTLESIKCDSHASLFTHIFVSPYFNHEPKVKVVTF